MDRVTIEQQEGVVRIQVNYAQEKVVEILIAIFILIPAAAVVPTCAGDMSLFPETAPGNVAAIGITIVCTMCGLMACGSGLTTSR